MKKILILISIPLLIGGLTGYSSNKREVIINEIDGTQTSYSYGEFTSVEFTEDYTGDSSDSEGNDVLNAVKLTQTEGEEMYFLLSEKPVVTMNENDIVLTTEAQEITFPKGDDLTFEFGDYESLKVDEVLKNEVIFEISKDIIKGYNLMPGSQVSVFDLSGKKIGTEKANSNGEISVRMERLPKGIYVVNYKSTTFKFQKK